MRPWLALFVIFFAPAASAGIFTCMDENGKVFYTNVPAESCVRPGIVTKRKRVVAPEVLDGLIRRAARSFGVDPLLIRAVIEVESNFDAAAVSRRGAMGLMQLMPDTARELEVRNPFDPEANIFAGTRYLRMLLSRFKGDLRLALAAYNAGPSVVAAAGTIPGYPETRRYVASVLAAYRRYTALSSPAKRWARVAYD